MGLWCLSWGDRPEFELYLDSVLTRFLGLTKYTKTIIIKMYYRG